MPQVFKKVGALFRVFLNLFAVGLEGIPTAKLRKNQILFQAVRMIRLIGISPVTAPAVIGQSIHQPGPQRVAMDIARKLRQVEIILHDKTLETSLKEITCIFD